MYVFLTHVCVCVFKHCGTFQDFLSYYKNYTYIYFSFLTDTEMEEK